MMIISDYHEAFQEQFHKDGVTAAHLHSLRKRKGWKVGRAPERYKGRSIKFTKAEIAWLRDNCAMVIGDYLAAFCEVFGRADITANGLHQLRKRRGWKTGRTGHFERGAAPVNKGKKMPFNANSAATQFKAGHRPHTWRGPGHESIGDDGYVWIIVDEKNPYTGAATRRVQKHRRLWEQKHGPIPKGFVLKCLDGDRANTDPSNWEAVPVGLLPRLNGKSGRRYDHAPAELKPTIMAVAKLEARVRQKPAGGQ